MREETELRVSASQINLFLNEPAIWVMNKLWKIYGDMGPAAWRGTAVEKGLESILIHEKNFEEACEWAFKVFDESATLYTGEDLLTQRELIPPMIKEATNLFLQLDGLCGTQIKVEGEISGVGLLGYADFDYGDFWLDLKTTTRCPSSIDTVSAEHMTQLAIYHILSGKRQKVAYVTAKKGEVFEPDEKKLKSYERRIIPAIKAMKMAWDMSFEDGDDYVATLFPPRDMGSFYWDEKTRTEANKIWKL